MSETYCSSAKQLRMLRAVLYINLPAKTKDPQMVATEGAGTFLKHTE